MISSKLFKDAEDTPGDHYDETEAQPDEDLHRFLEGKQKDSDAGEAEAGDLRLR